MNSVFAILTITLAAFACNSGYAQTLPILRVGRFVLGAGPLTTFENGVVTALAKGKATVQTVQLSSYQERLDCLTGGTAKFPTPGCDVVVAQFTITPDRQSKVTFIAPYYFGDGAGLKAKTATLAGQVVKSTNPAVAYKPYITAKTKTCIPAGSAYITSAQTLGLNVVIKADEAAIKADATCLLMVTDYTAEFAPYTRVIGPLLPGTALPQGVAVQLKKPGQTTEALILRAALTEAAVGLYQGTPGTTPLEKLNAPLQAKGLGSATAAIKTGAVFVNKFFTA